MKLGLQFIKKKFIDRIIRTSQEKATPLSEEFYFNDVVWNHKFCLWNGDMRVTRDKIEFCFKAPGDYSHLMLIKQKVKDDELLIREWRMGELESVAFQKFLLKNNTL